MSIHNPKESQKKEPDASTKNWHRADILAAIKKKGGNAGTAFKRQRIT